jgi:hypothetical protein
MIGWTWFGQGLSRSNIGISRQTRERVRDATNWRGTSLPKQTRWSVGSKRSQCVTAWLTIKMLDDRVCRLTVPLAVRTMPDYVQRRGRGRLPFRRSPSKLCAALVWPRGLRMDGKLRLAPPHNLKARLGDASAHSVIGIDAAPLPSMAARDCVS